MARVSFLKKQNIDDYLFDIDLLSQLKKPFYFIKTKNSIIHSFCESSVKKFSQKQRRRLTDFYHFQSQRHYDWNKNQLKNKVVFIFHNVFISPLFSLFAFTKKPDPAWFFHPLACWITLFIYTQVTIKHSFKTLKPINRKKWQQ